MIKISIVIPVYNVDNYLSLCLDSVLDQYNDEIEIICINDGSTDRSGKILNEYLIDNPHINIIHQENKGLSFARNTGICLAKGEYVMFLDSDDYLENGALDIIKKELQNVDLLCFNGRRYFEDSNTIEDIDSGVSIPEINGWDYYNRYSLKQHNFHFVSVVLRAYNRMFLLSNNLFFHEGIFHEDNLFTPIACYYAQVVKVIPNCLYNYRIRTGSITQTYDVKRLIDSIKVANLLYEFFFKKVDVDKSIVYRVISGEYFKGFMEVNIKKFGNNDKLLSDSINWSYFKAVSLYPRHKRVYIILRIHPRLLRLYFNLEKTIKSMC